MEFTLKQAKLMLCCGLAAISTVAGATVNKCVDQDGQVLFTDMACPQGSRYVDPQVSDDPGAGIIINNGVNKPFNTTGAERVPADAQPAAEAPRSRWASLPRPLQRKAISLDASTLQTARMNLQMQDELHKQRRVASTR